MRTFTLTFAVFTLTTFLAACASPPQQPGAPVPAPANAVAAACVDRDAPVGTNITRRDKTCVAMTDKERDAARAQLERAADRQSGVSAGSEATRLGR